MTYVLFVGDMLVMAFMIVLVIWVSLYTKDSEIESVARIPLEDDEVNDG